MTQSANGDLSIGEFARRAGVRPSAIRYYESAGLLPPPKRQSGQRRYEAGMLRRLAIIRLAQQAGFTIANIRDLFDGLSDEMSLSERWRVLARRKLPEVRALIHRAQEMERWIERGLECGCLSIDECRLIDETPLASPDASSSPL